LTQESIRSPASVGGRFFHPGVENQKKRYPAELCVEETGGVVIIYGYALYGSGGYDVITSKAGISTAYDEEMLRS